MSEERREIESKAENAIHIIHRQWGSNQRLKRLILKKLRKNGELTDTDFRYAVDDAKAEAEVEERRKVEKSKIAEQQRKERMSFGAQYPRMFLIRNNSPQTFIDWMKAQDSKEMSITLKELQQNRQRLNSVYNFELLEAERLLSEELTKRKNFHNIIA